MIHTIIFDLDGTLLNTIDDIADSSNATLEHFNLPTKTKAQIMSYVGNGAVNLVKLLVPSDSSEELVQVVCDYYLSHYKKNIQNKTAPYEGILETLSKLKEEGYQLAILSNKPESGVTELNKQYFSDFISHAYGECQGIPKKPAKDGVLRTIANMGANLQTTIYVGDSEVDIKTAKNSGIPCVAVTWGFRTKEELLSHNPEYMIDNPFELLDILTKEKKC